MKSVIRAAMLGLVFAGGVKAREMRNVHGRVVDPVGRPVANADISYYWRANGPLNDQNGTRYDLNTAEGLKVFWANMGRMFPLGNVDRPTRTGPDGRFRISIPSNRHHLLVMDQPRVRGGLVILPKQEDENGEIEIRLVPLVRVKGVIVGPGAGERPEWPNVFAMLPDDLTRPLDLTMLLLCGSPDGHFEMSLPPGHYVLNATTIRGDGAEIAELNANTAMILTGEISQIDLGVLRLCPFKPRPEGRIERAKAAGTWGDYTKHYGEKPPPWQITDARGIRKDTQISDFKGKWVLVYFWGLSCYPCLKQGIPDLIKFYDEHQAQRERFEILTLCMDVDGKLESVADLDKRLEPFVKHVWGKPLPFPTLLDSSFSTWESYGLPAFGILVLIDPQGNLVQGDETVLAAKLKER